MKIAITGGAGYVGCRLSVNNYSTEDMKLFV